MPKKNKIYTIGLDIGGTNMKAVLFDGEKVIANDSLATPKDSLDHFLVMVKAILDPMLEKAKDIKARVKGIGLGIAGTLNFDRNIMLVSPNIPIINNVDLLEKLKSIIDLPIVIDNDTNCFVRAEAKIGVGKGRQSIYGIIIGTGIGGGWWVNNEIYKGAHGGGGEPGSFIIDLENSIGLEEAYHKIMQNNPAQMAEEAYRGDILAERTYEELGRILGTTFANIVNLINPEIFILGGSVVESSNLFLSQAKKTMKTHIESSEARKKVKIVKGKLGDNAGAIGAALLAQSK